MPKAEIQGAAYSKEIEEGMLHVVEDVADGKIEINAHSHRKLHAKIYIFRPEYFNEYFSGEVITGNSNLTEAGLGHSDTSNYEFNVALREFEDVKLATEEFDPNTSQNLPDGFKRLTYQIDVMEQGGELLKKHPGFFLADVGGGSVTAGSVTACCDKGSVTLRIHDESNGTTKTASTAVLSQNVA